MYVVAIIAAGGSGRRVGGTVPKQLIEIGGRSILARSVEAFLATDGVNEILVVLPPDLVAHPPALPLPLKPLRMIAGGPSRQESVANGVDAAPSSTDLFVIHDAARPFVTQGLIARTIDAAIEGGAAMAAVPANDTVKQVTGQGESLWVEQTLDRAVIYLAQTPQAFTRRILLDAIARGRQGAEATDEAALVEQGGHRVRVVAGDPRNIKITTEADLEFARRLAGDRQPVGAMRVGIGYDLHVLTEGRRLVLGGVTVPHERGLAGHSDADAVCHALIDAILGAAAAGNIGRHFPDTDARWKDAASIELLRRAAAFVTSKGFVVENVDVVIVAERPRIGPHVDHMCLVLAQVLGIETERVNIKAKTNEGVGELGRGEAIAVHAIALLAKRSLLD